MKYITRIVHANHGQCPLTGALTPPLVQSSTFGYGTAEEGKARFAGESSGFIYSRFGNPTVAALEHQMAVIENAEESLALASGMAAASSILYALLNSGDEMAYIEPIYGGTSSLLLNCLTRAGIKVSGYASDSELEEKVSPETKVIFFEPITNPNLKVNDYRRIKRAAEKIGAVTVCDNTFLTPYFFRPLDHGIDLVMHSGTKYLSGHGDVIAGVVSGRKELISKIRTVALKHIGAPLGPQEAYLLQRGIRSLGIRMEAHQKSAQKVAEFLAQHPKVSKVFYPGLESDPGHAILKETADGFGAMVSLEVPGGFENAAILLNSLKLFAQAVSLGDLESLACHPASTTHAALPKESRILAGVTEELIRLSIGVEDPSDLIDDLSQALDMLPG